MQKQDYGLLKLLKTQIYMCEVSPDPTDVISLEASLTECGFSSIPSNLPSGLLDNIHQIFFFPIWTCNVFVPSRNAMLFEAAEGRSEEVTFSKCAALTGPQTKHRWGLFPGDGA